LDEKEICYAVCQALFFPKGLANPQEAAAEPEEAQPPEGE
jgi:hypothetical protein